MRKKRRGAANSCSVTTTGTNCCDDAAGAICRGNCSVENVLVAQGLHAGALSGPNSFSRLS